MAHGEALLRGRRPLWSVLDQKAFLNRLAASLDRLQIGSIMNAHTTIAQKDDARGNQRSGLSSAYCRGIVDGLGATTIFFQTQTYPRASAIDVSVAGAWKAVNSALNEASRKEVDRIGKAARKTARSKG